MDLIEALKKDREESKLSFRKYAKEWGISARMYTAILSGERRLGGKSLSLLLRFRPKLKKLIWEYIDNFAERKR